MNKIEFYNWRTLWQASPTLALTITDNQGILEYRNSGTSVSDIYFNDAEYSYWDIVLDLSAIQNYLNPLTDANPISPSEPWTPSAYDVHNLLWRYGVRLYKDDELLFTGLVFLESININETQYTFKFTANSVLGTLKKINQTLDVIPGSPLYTLQSIGDHITTLYSTAISMLLGGSLYKPQLYNTYGFITMPNTTINYTLPGYDNDFDDWESGVTILTNDYLVDNIISIGFYPPVSGGADNYPAIFMLKTWRRFSNNVYFMAFTLKVIQFSPFNPLYPVSALDVHWENNSSSGGAMYQIIDSYLPNSEQYFSFPVSTSFQIPANDYLNYSITLGADNSSWTYSGDFYLSEIMLNEETTSLNFYNAMEDIAYLRQQMPINDPEGNITFTARPPLLDTIIETDVSNQVIDNVTKGGVYIRRVDSASTYSFINANDNLLRFINRYSALIANKYKVKLYLVYDGFPLLSIGNKIRYDGHYYIVTAIRPDYVNYKTTIEAYGEV